MRTREYRRIYRRAVLPKRYSAARHVVVVGMVGLVTLLGLLLHFSPRATATDWWAIPLTLVVASLVEYVMHRGPMHHPTRGLTALHERHTRRHHRYFTADAMSLEEAHDLHVVLFPPLLIGCFLSVAAALAALVGWVWSSGAGGLFFATSLAYYLTYEILHLTYHLPVDAAPRWRWLRWLKRHHQLHHDPKAMLSCNFNLVLPIFDWALGTLNQQVEPISGTGNSSRLPLRR